MQRLHRSKAAAAQTARSTPMKNHIYFLRGGAIYTTTNAPSTEAITRRSATIILTARRTPFDVHIGRRAKAHRAVAIKPLVKHEVKSDKKQRFITIAVYPLHPDYRRFRLIDNSGLLSLPRTAFASLDAQLNAIYEGRLSREQASRLFEAIVATVMRHLPEVKPLDERIERLLDLIEKKPGFSLDRLANAAGLSYHRVSHLFAETMGLPLRSFLLWRKVYRSLAMFDARNRDKLADVAREAGFTDLAHLSRTFQQAFGAPPTYFLHSGDVKVLTRPD